MTDIPDALVEKAARALPNKSGYQNWRHNTHEAARLVLAAVWPDLPAARPVVDAGRLAEVMHERRHLAWPCPYEACGHLRLAREDADALLAAGVVQDAADVRRAVAAEIEAEARAAMDLVTDPATARTLYNDGQVEALGRFLRIAREAGERS